jgi:hypothetical protein
MQKQAGSGSGINTPGSDAMPAYAEVDPNHTAPLTTFQGHRGCDERCRGPASSDGSSSPAPYATTTLVGSSRQHLNGLVGTLKNYLLHAGCTFYSRFSEKNRNSFFNICDMWVFSYALDFIKCPTNP